MLDMVGRLNPEVCGIWSSLGGLESVMILEPHGKLSGEREGSEYFDVELVEKD